MAFAQKRKYTNQIKKKNVSNRSACNRKKQSPFFMNHYNILSISLTIKPDANDMNIKSERKLSLCTSLQGRKEKAYQGSNRESKREGNREGNRESNREGNRENDQENNQESYKAGSLTVEAALVFPLLLFLILMILYLFQIQRLELEIREALYDAAQNIAATSYAMELANEKTGTDLTEILELGTGEISLQKEIKDPSLLRLILGGRAGILCTRENEDENEVVLKASVILRIPKLVFRSRVLMLQESVCVKKWTGYDPNSGSKETMVYVTEYGDVYHTDRDCTYLNPSVHAITKQELVGERSEDGSIYQRCPLCGKEAGAVVYITDYGEVYHSSLTCSGLKRTVYCLPEEENGKRACSKCGGNHSE